MTLLCFEINLTNTVICRESFIRRKRMVLFQPQRPEVSQRIAPQSGCGFGLLEGDRNGQNNLVGREERGHKEGTGVLCWKSSEGNKNKLDYARVSPYSFFPENWKLQGRTTTKHVF